MLGTNDVTPWLFYHSLKKYIAVVHAVLENKGPSLIFLGGRILLITIHFPGRAGRCRCNDTPEEVPETRGHIIPTRHMKRPVSIFLSSPGWPFSWTRSCPWNKNHTFPCLVERDSVLVSGLIFKHWLQRGKTFRSNKSRPEWKELAGLDHLSWKVKKGKEYLQNLRSWHCTFPSLPADGDVVLQGCISATVDSEMTRTEGTWSCGSGTPVHLVNYAQRCEHF